MAITEKEHGWSHWAGTPAELAQALRIAADVVEPWQGHGAGHVKVTVAYTDGLTQTFAKIEEFEEGFDMRDRRKVKILSAEVGWVYRDGGAELRLDPSEWGESGLRVRVRGPDRTAVEGLVRRLQDVLDPRVRLAVPGLTALTVSIAMSVGFAVTSGTVAFPLAAYTDVGRGVRVVLSTMSGVLVALVVLVAFRAGRRVEFLMPGERPRFQRWRAALFALLGTVVLSIGTSVAATALYSG